MRVLVLRLTEGAAIMAKKAQSPNKLKYSGGALGDLIGSVEAGKAGYDAFNRGSADSSGAMNLSRLSIGEILSRQSLPKDDPQRLFAVGKYQLIPSTLRDAVQKLALDQSTRFTARTQENLFRNYLIAIKRPKVKDYIVGKADDIATAQVALAMEFASIARPDTGKSHYGGSNANLARITAEQTAKALQEERNAYQASQEKAWNHLSRGL
jgi:hypothetical protein